MKYQPNLRVKWCDHTFLFVLILLLPFSLNAQELQFQGGGTKDIKRQSEDKTYSIEFTIEKPTQPYKIECKINAEDKRNEAYPKRDYVFDNNSVTLNEDNGYKGKVDILIKGNNYKERLPFVITFSYTDDKKKEQKKDYYVIINAKDDGGAGEGNLTEKETGILDHVGIELFTGGTLDFFNNLKFQNIGGEFIINANDIAGPGSRLGGFIGISNFQNFTRDSSNINGRTQLVLLDTGTYVPGKSRYKSTRYIDYLKVSSNQWSYYVNPTYRLNDIRSDFFNIYLSLRLEALVVSTTRSYTTDTLFTDTSTRALQNPVFQSGKGYLIQNLSDIQTSGYFSVGIPMFLNAKGKFKLYFDPNLGIARYNISTYRPNNDQSRLEKIIVSDVRPFYLVRMRVSEQFSGLQVTIGGEIRGFLKDYAPTINAYLGIRANIAGLLGAKK